MTIAVELTIALAALLVEHEHLVSLYERRKYFAYNLGTFNSGGTYGDVTFVVYQQHFVKFNSLAAFCCGDVVDEELLAFFCLELLTVNLYDCVHCNINDKTVFSARRTADTVASFAPTDSKRLQNYNYFWFVDT